MIIIVIYKEGELPRKDVLDCLQSKLGSKFAVVQQDEKVTASKD